MRRSGWISLLGCAALAVTAGVFASTSSSARQAVKAITPSPVYTAKQLNAPAGNDWLVHFGSLNGNRYSSLTQVTKANVGTLKEAWHISLGVCATKNAACGSMESNGVVADGVFYTQVAPLGDVFALDAATGATLWKWTPTYETGFNVGAGGRRAGVAIGEGKVYAGLTDGHLVALDQQSGKVAWTTEVAPWRKGGKVSSAPIYANGMILVGDGAGDNGGNSASMQAFRAANGNRLWSWSVIPAPGQVGSETWTNDGKGGNGSSLYGGGSLWESPLIDTARKLVIFGTGNPEPWNSRGPGLNLFTDSIVALDLYTGQLKWYFQTTHHDLWDSDLPNNGVMFDAKYKIDGKLVKRPGVAFVNKVGMTFVLDRETGKPLIPVDEVPVPQSTAPDVNTWPTQPVPRTKNVLFNPIGKDGIPCVDPNVSQTSLGILYSVATAPDGKPYKNGCAYDPYDTTQYVVVPFEMMDWPASSFSPENNTMITCGVTGRARAMEQIPAASQVAGAFGGLGVSQLGVSDGSPPTSNTGNFAALDVTTGKLKFWQHWPAICYSGSVNTASGITFVGHYGTGNGSDGKGWLEAVDTANGKSLWKSPLMNYPVASAPITYSVGGKQYVTVEVGGAGHNDVTRPLGLTNPARLRGDDIYSFMLP